MRNTLSTTSTSSIITDKVMNLRGSMVNMRWAGGGKGGSENDVKTVLKYEILNYSKFLNVWFSRQAQHTPWLPIWRRIYSKTLSEFLTMWNLFPPVCEYRSLVGLPSSWTCALYCSPSFCSWNHSNNVWIPLFLFHFDSISWMDLLLW